MSYYSSSYDVKPYRDHKKDPAISMYMMSSSVPEMEKLSCLFCKRTIVDIKGTIDKVVSTPLPVDDYDIAVNIRCKLCGQNYRLLATNIK